MASGLSAASDTLTPLPASLHNGLIVVTVMAFISFISTFVLLAYIKYRLVKWEMVSRGPAQLQIGEKGDRLAENDGSNDLSLGLEERHYHHIKTTPKTQPNEVSVPRSPTVSTTSEKKDTRWNPVLLLIYNLLCANLMQSLAFLITATWLKEDGIIVSLPSCWAQGFFMQVGKLSLSGMLILISINTYLTIVRGYKTPRLVVQIGCAAIWLLAYIIPSSGIIATNNGRDAGGYYVRANSWCWVNSEYASFRLWLDYFWVFLSIIFTILLTGLVLFSLYRNNQSARHLPARRNPAMEPRERDEPPRPSGHHPAFLVYPLIYVLCAAPLALGRMIEMSGHPLGLTYYCVAGAAIASHGWLNVLLWSTTMIFIGDKDIHETGLDIFSVIKTPKRRYGNMIWVQGGNENDGSEEEGDGVSWWQWLSGGRNLSAGASPRGHGRSISQESLRRNAGTAEENTIQMEVVTMVVVENADGTDRGKLGSGDSAGQDIEHKIEV